METTRFIEHETCESSFWVCEKCEEEWVWEENNPKENNVNYCPNCGRKISDYAGRD